MEEDQKNRLKKLFRGNLLFNAPLRDFISFQVGGPAEVIAFPEDQEDLINILIFICQEKLPSFVLGEGTNLLVRDGGFKGIMIKLSAGFNTIRLKDKNREKVYVSAQAGARLSRLIQFSLRQSLTGLEFAAGIPGSVGGAIAMNAGAYGGETKNAVHSLTLITLEGEPKYCDRSSLNFSYRKLELPSATIITEAVFELYYGNSCKIAYQIKKNLTERKKHQPLNLPSAGSVFKNPPGFYAAQLIEEAGLKGYQIGGAAISEKHANFIVNTGKATAADIENLILLVQEKVEKKKGIRLEPEIQIIGERERK
jgi:UDP-N-acetylmuramate dehydrogenase